MEKLRYVFYMKNSDCCNVFSCVFFQYSTLCSLKKYNIFSKYNKCELQKSSINNKREG